MRQEVIIQIETNLALELGHLKTPILSQSLILWIFFFEFNSALFITKRSLVIRLQKKYDLRQVLTVYFISHIPLIYTLYRSTYILCASVLCRRWTLYLFRVTSYPSIVPGVNDSWLPWPWDQDIHRCRKDLSTSADRGEPEVAVKTKPYQTAEAEGVQQLQVSS